MTMVECFSILLLGIAVVAASMNLLNTNTRVDEIDKQIGYIFEWIGEVENRVDRIDHDIQKKG